MHRVRVPTPSAKHPFLTRSMLCRMYASVRSCWTTMTCLQRHPTISTTTIMICGAALGAHGSLGTRVHAIRTCATTRHRWQRPLPRWRRCPSCPRLMLSHPRVHATTTTTTTNAPAIHGVAQRTDPTGPGVRSLGLRPPRHVSTKQHETMGPSHCRLELHFFSCWLR